MLYVLYILYSHNKENVIRKIIKENTFTVLRYCIVFIKTISLQKSV